MKTIIFFIAFITTAVFLINGIKSFIMRKKPGTLTKVSFWIMSILWTILYCLSN